MVSRALNLKLIESSLEEGIISWEVEGIPGFSRAVMGALSRKTDPKIATALKTQSRSKDQTDKGKFKVEPNGKT